MRNHIPFIQDVSIILYFVWVSYKLHFYLTQHKASEATKRNELNELVPGRSDTLSPLWPLSLSLSAGLTLREWIGICLDLCALNTNTDWEGGGRFLAKARVISRVYTQLTFELRRVCAHMRALAYFAYTYADACWKIFEDIQWGPESSFVKILLFCIMFIIF